jgi:putative ABC transport system ATP-binding protein
MNDGDALVVEARGLTRRFASGAMTVDACHDIDLDVRRGEFVVVQGRSGSGKSTLLGLLAGLLRPSSGSATVLGVDVAAASEDRLVRMRAEDLSLVPQRFGLLDALTAGENVEVPLRLVGTDPRERDRAVAEALDAVGLAKHVRQRPSELSGGQQQRVAVARAIVRPGRLLLADEPTGSLDSATAADITDLLHGLARELGVAVVATTHDPVVIARADRVLHVSDGRLAAA